MGVVDRARGQLPPFLDAYLPASAAEFRVAIGDWLSKHLSELQLVGKDAAHMFVTLLIGMVLGAIIALQRVPDLTKRKPLAAALFDRLHTHNKSAPPLHRAARMPPQTPASPTTTPTIWH